MLIVQLIEEIIENRRQGLLYVLAMLFSIVISLVLHEVAHGLVALWNGDATAKLRGRLSLNPLKHFDIIGLLMMLIVGIGWAKPVPVDPRNYKNYKKGSITVALAGVITNILLAFIFAMPAVILGNIRVDALESESVYYLVYFFYCFCSLTVQLNVSLALFNLLPLYPLDGYRLVASFVNENKPFMRFVRKYSLYVMIGLIALNNIPYISGYAPLRLYISVLGGWISDGFYAFWGLMF